MKVRTVIPLIAMLLGCSSESSKLVLVPIARVHYDAFKEGNEIISTLKANGIPATWEQEATVVFPILVPKRNVERALAILQTNYLVTSGKVQLYPIAGSPYGQICATNVAGVVFTNKIGQTQAITAASHLTNGMREEDAKKFLERNGLGWSLSVGDSFGWYVSFPLTNGCSLGLDIKPKKFRSDGAWKDGLVKAAFIQSNGVNIVAIALTNAP